jgi:uncharacterized protein (TIGR03435 family)
MRSLSDAGIVACLLGSAAFAQSASPVSFAAADVHPTKSSGRYQSSLLLGGRYQIRNATLLGLIRTAWGIDRETVSGGPPWLDDDRFDVIALLPAGSSPADHALMLRGLLADRFGLVTHDDKQPVQVFALVRSKRGAQLKPSGEDGVPGCEQSYQSGEPLLIAYGCQHNTMAAFAAGLRPLDPSVTRPVVDRTGLQGAWDFTIRFTPLFEFQKAVAAEQASTGIKLFDALEKLGLRLEPREEVLPVLAIDRVNRNPTPNAADIAEKLPPAADEFEVANIKPSKPDTPQSEECRGERVEIFGYTLRRLIRFAWQLDDNRIADLPRWMETERYDVVAKAPHDTAAEDLFPMLKSLLIDRFKLATHTADRPVPVFLLTAGKNPKLKEGDPASRPECSISRGQTGKGPSAMPLKVYTCRNMTMAKFAELIRPQAAGYLRSPVVDQTGLKGAYDFTLSWTRNDVVTAAQNRNREDGSPSDPIGAITVFDAVEHQLGLKLEGGRKYPLPVLIVDHAEPVTD